MSRGAGPLRRLRDALGARRAPPPDRFARPVAREGAPVQVARAANQPEAEMIAALLREAGIPSMQRRSAGFDVPDFLAGGPREILVPQSAVDAAREALARPPR